MPTADMIPATKAFKDFGLPRPLLRELAERGVIRSAERQIDVCHSIKLYSSSDIVKFLDEGGGANGEG